MAEFDAIHVATFLLTRLLSGEATDSEVDIAREFVEMREKEQYEEVLRRR